MECGLELGIRIGIGAVFVISYDLGCNMTGLLILIHSLKGLNVL